VFQKLLKKGRQALEVVEAMVDKGRLKKYDKVIKRAQKKLTQSKASRYTMTLSIKKEKSSR